MPNTDNDISHEHRGPSSWLPEFLFHATPLRNLASIRERGLLGEMKRWDSEYPAGVYLGTEDASGEYTRFTGETGADEDDVEFVVLKVSTRLLDPSRLKADDWEIGSHWDELESRGYSEDRFGEVPWQASLELTGQVFYDGDIPPEALTLHAMVGCDLKATADLSGSADRDIKALLRSCKKDTLTYGEAIRLALELHRANPEVHTFERLHGALSDMYTSARVSDFTSPVFAR